MPRLKALQELRKSYQKFADGDLTADQLEGRPRSDQGGHGPVRRTTPRRSARRPSRASRSSRPTTSRSSTSARWSARASRGMYRVAEIKMPDDLKDQLTKAKDLTRQGDQGAAQAMPACRSASAKTWTRNKDVGTRHERRACGSSWTTTRRTSTRKASPDVDKEIDGQFTRHRRADPPRRRPRRAAGRHADPQQPGLQGRHPGRRPDHRDHPRDRREAASRSRRRK